MIRSSLLLIIFLAPALAQSPEALLKDPTVQAAFAAADRNEPHFLDEQARFCQIPAPPFKEEVRGKEFVRLFTQLGLKDVRMDKAGNVVGVGPAHSLAPTWSSAPISTPYSPKVPTSKSPAKAP